MPTDCTPEKVPCECQGFTWNDWFYSLFRRACDSISWLASIRNVLNVGNNGYVQLAPSYLQIDASVAAQKVTIPAGAMSIQAVIDNEYAASHRLEIYTGASATVKLPAGSDFTLPVISPVFYAASDGSNGLRGTGQYGQVQIKFPAGSVGFVEAIYRTTPLTITTANA